MDEVCAGHAGAGGNALGVVTDGNAVVHGAWCRQGPAPVRHLRTHTGRQQGPEQGGERGGIQSIMHARLTRSVRIKPQHKTKHRCEKTLLHDNGKRIGSGDRGKRANTGTSYLSIHKQLWVPADNTHGGGGSTQKEAHTIAKSVFTPGGEGVGGAWSREHQASWSTGEELERVMIDGGKME